MHCKGLYVIEYFLLFLFFNNSKDFECQYIKYGNYRLKNYNTNINRTVSISVINTFIVNHNTLNIQRNKIYKETYL